MNQRALLIALLGGTLLTATAALFWNQRASNDAAPSNDATSPNARTTDESKASRPTGESLSSRAPAYVGSATCASCHGAETSAWTGSHHQLAMQPASEKTVLGDFRDASFRAGSVVTKFFRKDERFYVRTDGPDGKLADYEVKFTLGVYPLQGYLLDFGGGRLQAFSVTWDARPKSEGGQRWFHQHPNEAVDARDELHWTRPSQNWNSMCAECHTTNLKKGYDATSDTFRTTYSEPEVACESCHGPGSNHLAWATTKEATNDVLKGFSHLFSNRRTISWSRAEGQPTAKPTPAPENALEIETCARCHARRSTLTERYTPGQPLNETHLLALLLGPAFHSDGQIREEDFEYASFTQSKMFHAGVSCSDCHDPHSQKVRAPGNALCGGCHAPDVFDAPSHHHHETGSSGASCVNCHMPATNFMVIHARHDHSLRIPRPDLSEKLGVPNACTTCHSERSATWAREKTDAWYPRPEPRKPHYGEALSAGDLGVNGAAPALLRVARAKTSPEAPLLARAAATTLLANQLTPETLAALPELLGAPDATLRRAALTLVDRLPPEERWSVARKLLSDENLAVRAEAARVLGAAVPSTASHAERASLASALADYIKIANENAEQPQSQVNLGLLYDSLNEPEKAETAYRAALRLDPRYVIATINFADFYARRGKNDAALRLLSELRSKIKPDADLEHALGLQYVRVKKLDAARGALENAARLRPDDVRYGFVLAIALHDMGEKELATTKLLDLSERFPNALDPLLALVSYLRAEGRLEKARPFAERALALRPEFGSVEAILSGKN